MDIATLLGLIFGTAVIAFAMLSDSNVSVFINIPGIMIVLGGTIAATLIKFPVGDCLRAIGLAIRKAFWQEADRPADLIQRAKSLAEVVHGSRRF